MHQSIQKICEDAENRFQPQLGEGRVCFRPFLSHSLTSKHVSSDSLQNFKFTQSVYCTTLAELKYPNVILVLKGYNKK
jgi:hypothetical protein